MKKRDELRKQPYLLEQLGTTRWQARDRDYQPIRVYDLTMTQELRQQLCHGHGGSNGLSIYLYNDVSTPWEDAADYTRYQAKLDLLNRA